MKEEKCLCHDCFKSFFLEIATFSFAILYIMTSRASLHVSSKLGQLN